MSQLIKNRISQKLRNAPNKTGVYFFLNERGKTLYVGKAINIKNRLRNHFANDATTNPAKAKLLKETRNLAWELCDSEPEALIREAECIKKLKPQYNILLRDDKNYFYVGITREPFPKVFLTHQIGKQELGMRNEELGRKPKKQKIPTSYFLLPTSRFVGPFTDGNSLKRTLKLLRRIFPYCTCRTPHQRECLATMLGRCVGMCCLKPRIKDLRFKIKEQKESRKNYLKNIKSLEEVLRGKRQRLVGALKKNMQKSAREHRFEDAAHLRDQFQALEAIFSHRAVVANGEFLEERKKALDMLQKLLKLPHAPSRIEMYDMSNIQGKFAVGSMVVFANGMPDKSQYRRFRIKTVAGIDDIAMMQEVIERRLKHVAQKAQITNVHKSQTKSEWPMPDVLIVDGGKGQISAAVAAFQNTNHQLHKSPAIPILGLAKGKDELHYILYNLQRSTLQTFTIPLSRLPRPLRHLFNHLQAEAHRFAITYYRKRHTFA